MTTPLSTKGSGKSCAVSGCTEPRLHRNYCAKHHNASLGKSDPLRVGDLERCMTTIMEAIQQGQTSSSSTTAETTSHNRNGDIPSATPSIPIQSVTPDKVPTVSTSASASYEYLHLIQPYAEKILENIKNLSAPQPLPGSTLDIFSFSSLTTNSSSASSAGGSSSTPPRPIQASPSDPDLSNSQPPPSPDGNNSSHSGLFNTGPIIDIKVQFSKQKKKTPVGYELLERSISGKYDADVNKGGSGKSVLLCYQRGEDPVQAAANAAAAAAAAAEPSKSENDSDFAARRKIPQAPAPSDIPKPITSLSIIFRDASEEPPYGFVAIDKTTLGVDANLNNNSNGTRQVYLCVHRGEGAPIYDLGVIFHDKKELLPAGFHEVKHTPFGNRADLNAAVSTSDGQPTAHQAVFLCFRPHVTPVLQSYPPLLTDRLGQDSMSKGHLLYARVLALLTALLYSYDQKIVLHALAAFAKIPPESIPPVLLNRFLQCVCDAAPCFQTYFTTQAHTSLLQVLAHAFKTFYSIMTIETFAKMLEVCFLTRHEDKQTETSEGMIAGLISKIERAKPCACSVKEKREAANIGMNAVAGGEGHSSQPTHKSGPSNGSAVGITPALSPSDGSPTNSTPPPPVSNILCSSCQTKRALAGASINTFCRELTLQLITNVHTAKELEGEVKTFQRHTSTGPDFRSDIAKLTAILANIDTAHQAHLEKIAVEPQPTPTGRPTSSGGRGSIVGGLSINSDSSDSIVPAPLTSTSASVFAFDMTKQVEKDRIYLPNKEERFLQVATLICAKFAGEPVSFGLVKSEQMKRKHHALRLLFYILHHGVYFFRSTPGGILLIRRFICPALMQCCVTDNNQLWRLILQTFTVLYDQYKQHLMIELGVFFDHICISLLESVHVSYELKKDILDMFYHILGKEPQHLIGLFYNYDNHSKNWTIFERLNTVLARITEGEQKSFIPIIPTQPTTQPGEVSPATQTPSQIAELYEQQDDALQRQALKILVHILHMLAQWVGVPGLKRSPDIPSKPLLTEADDVDITGTGMIVSVESSIVATPTSTSTNNSTTNHSLAPPTAASRIHRPSMDTWSWRHDKQKQDQKTLQESLKLARTEKLKSALQYLRIVDPSYAQPKQMAHFLFTNEGLDKAEVGDFLGSCGDKFMPDSDYEALRAAYLEHLDFTGLLFDQGLRLFLCDSGFRLPGEAQKIDRLLEAFCLAYCRDNPNVFRNSSSAFIVSFALVMLNTDLHDSRLKSGASRRQPMTEEQFIGNLRGVDDKHDFPRVFLETLYRNIAAQAIEWKEKPKHEGHHSSGSHGSDEKNGGKENQTDAEKGEDQAKAVRKTFEITVRRALAYLKNWAAHEQGYNRTSNTMIAAGMFEVIWYRIISAITLRSDNYKPGDVELLHICLEGLTYGSTIAICLGLPTERQAFSRQLAKITFIEKNRDSIKANGMHLRIVQGEHLKQEWYRPFNLLCDKSPVRACHTVFECAYETKQRINYERRQAKLRQVESEFNHEIVLVDPSRSFVREGPLTKLSNSSNSTKKQQYMFMLFNDLILYASEGMNSKWKCHRVIHLSLCRLEDLRGIARQLHNKTNSEANAFRIVSPQKSFVVSAPSKEKKQQWLESIFHHLKLVMAKRKKYIEEAKKAASGSQSNGTTASSAGVTGSVSPMSPSGSTDDNGREELLRRYSTFIGQSDNDLSRFARQDSGNGIGGRLGSGNNVNQSTTGTGSAATTKSTAPNHCKLCIRPWAIFRRKQKCRYCNDSVCNDCCTQKCMIPGGEKRLVNVCDACYGALKGMVRQTATRINTHEKIGDEVKLLTISDS